jgi:hypothetical protein
LPMPLAPWPTRLFLVAFVGAVAVCGAFSVEAWPLTGFRLFSRERHELATGWMATSVNARGHETRIRFARFPPADGYFIAIMATYGQLSPDEQAATCRAWARLVRSHGASTAGGLRLYATKRHMRLHVGRRERVRTQARLRWTCSDRRGVRAAAGTAARATSRRRG